MITYPQINPVAFSLGPIHIHWYGIMYLLGFAMAYGLAIWRTRHYKLNWTTEQISDLIFYAAVGVIIGGRVGYMVFYNPQQFIQEPLSLFKIWEGGMSFHGGFLGVLIALIFFAKKMKRPFWEISDFMIPLVPLGLAAGRAGNFINGELWGRFSDLPWAMIFPQADNQPRHPSQLYEFGLEGIVLFIVIWWYANKPRPAGCVSAIFLIGYALCRFIIEFFRQPDNQLGFVAFNWLTMGQLLSIPMLLGGIILYFFARTRQNAKLSSTH